MTVYANTWLLTNIEAIRAICVYPQMMYGAVMRNKLLEKNSPPATFFALVQGFDEATNRIWV